MYQQPGGEDQVFEGERKLLSDHGHVVETVVFDNHEFSRGKRLASMVGFFYNRASYRLIETRIRQFRPDVMHVHNFVFAASPSIFYAAAANNVPVVLTLHNFRMICPGATLFYRGKIDESSIDRLIPIKAIVNGVYRNSRFQTAAVAALMAAHQLLGTWRTKVDRYIVLTKFAKEVFSRSKLSDLGDRMVVKPNSVADRGTGPSQRQPYFLFVGRLTEEKGIRTLLHAAAAGGFELVIGGDGPLKPEVERYASQHGNIKYRGMMKKDDVIDVMKNCRALIFPSEWYEGFPITILEAFSTGTPVIASALGSMLEIVRDNDTGLLFRPGDANDLQRAVRELKDSTERLHAMQVNAREEYVRNYNPRSNYSRLITIYKDAISAHADSRYPSRSVTAAGA
jgi:glycosyltransferase involved in cell wall biosynthesis